MALIHNNTKNILIDCGSTADGTSFNIINNYLKGAGIDTIDIILITHFHSDHMNALAEICDNYKVKYVCFSIPKSGVEEYSKTRKYLKENNISLIEICEEDNIKLDGININILTPPKDKIIVDNDLLNANSTSYLISMNNKNYLFMGDSTIETEKYILNKYLNSNRYEDIKNRLEDIYVYQVSHHGSNTSSYENFIERLNIKNAIISAKKSIYGHPSESVLDTLNKFNIKIFITEKDGAIKI